MSNLRIQKVIAILLLVVVAPLDAQQSPGVDPRSTVEAFCKAEFDGNEDAYTMVTLSKGQQAKFRKELGNEKVSVGNMIAIPFNCAPLMIVSSYRVIGIRTHGATATAEVEYDVVGEFKRDREGVSASTMTSYKCKKVNEILKLRYSDGKNGMGWIRGIAWYLEDPPIPKVSIVAMERICQKELDKYKLIEGRAEKMSIKVPSNILLGISTFQKKIESLRLLK